LESALKFLLEPWVSLSPVSLIVKIIDILLVYYIIYRILLTLRGTRTLAIVIGFAGIYLAYTFSTRLGLETLGNLLDAFFSKLSIFVIFALIIFQEDIRRALTRMGTFRSKSPFIQAKAIDEVVQAAGALAGKRIGALIIFEGKADLDMFVTEGVELDSALTREALFSIFIPSFENPLHDGAVLIRNYRIYKAAAIIRHLTARSDLPKELGTRHRAAIGITEETDALAIVVSEERGAISVCFHGKLIQSLSIAELRKILDARFRGFVKEDGYWNLWGLFSRKTSPKHSEERRSELGSDALLRKKDGESVMKQAHKEMVDGVVLRSVEDGGVMKQNVEESQKKQKEGITLKIKSGGGQSSIEEKKEQTKSDKEAILDDPEVFVDLFDSK